MQLYHCADFQLQPANGKFHMAMQVIYMGLRLLNIYKDILRPSDSTLLLQESFSRNYHYNPGIISVWESLSLCVEISEYFIVLICG
jgi:hypothetical protein